MLQNQIIHLKNIVVFKIIFCVLAIVFVLWRLPLSYNQLQEIEVIKNSAQEELLNIQRKIQYITDYQNVIDSAYQAYVTKLQRPTSSCVMTAKISEQYTALANTFRLKSIPIVTASPTPIITKFYDSQSIETFAIIYDVSFQAQGFKHALSFIKNAYQLLPNYSLIYAIKISEDEVITPESIAKLSTGVTPQLIECKIGLQVREVRAK